MGSGNSMYQFDAAGIIQILPVTVVVSGCFLLSGH
jgi:hypothetical protein